MKYLLHSIIVFGTAFAANVSRAEVVASCQDTKIIAGVVEETGDYIFEDYDLQLTVETNSETKYGYQTMISHEGEQSVELDTDFKRLYGDAAREAYEAIEGQALLGVESDQIDSAAYSDIGVEGNRDDANGLQLLEVFDAHGITLGKILRVGWGMGVCK